MSTAYTKIVSKSFTNVLSLADAKTHLRILAADTTQDALVTACMQAGIRWAEHRTERFFSTTVMQIRIEPVEATIILPYPDLVEVTKLEAVIPGQANQVLYNKTGPVGVLADYMTVDDWANPAEITVITEDIPAETTYLIITATFGHDTKTPEDVIQAIKMLIGHFYDNPREVEVGRITSQIPSGADMILSHYHFKRYA